MASELTTRHSPKKPKNQTAVLRSWADLRLDPASLRPAVKEVRGPTPERVSGAELERHTRPLPRVNLSRLIDLQPEANRGDVQPPTDINTVRRPQGQQQRWVLSARRSLFQAGMVAVIMLTAAGIVTSGPLTGQAWAQSSSSGADLAITGSVKTNGHIVRWTATVRNQGPGRSIQPVRVIQALPAGLDYVSSFGEGWTCALDAAASTVSCDLSEELGVGQRRQLGIVTTVNSSAVGQQLPATLAVVGRNSDADLSNNTINLVATVAVSKATAGDGATRSNASGAGSAGTTDQSNSAGTKSADDLSDLTELPKTGAGSTVVLALTGVLLCLAGRRLLQLSAAHAPVSIASRLNV